MTRPALGQDRFTYSTFVKDMPGARFVITSDGKEKWRQKICPTYFTRDPAFRKKLYSFYRRKHNGQGIKAGDTVLLDYEPWDYNEWCFCEGCRGYFAEMHHLPAVPSTQEIREKYREQWREFKFRESDTIVRLLSDVVKKAIPGVTIGIYDYAVHESPAKQKYRRNSVALDCRRFEDTIDFHLLAFYRYNGKEACDLIDYNSKLLTKPVWMISNISRADITQGHWTSSHQQLSPKQVGLKLLGSAASGAAGFANFTGMDVDATFFVAIDRAMSEVAALEEFYVDGCRVDQLFSLAGKGLNDVVLRAHEFNGQVAITLINFDKTVTADITLQAVDPARLKGLNQLYFPQKDNPDAALFEQVVGPGLKLKLEPLSEQFLVLKTANAQRIHIADGK